MNLRKVVIKGVLLSSVFVIHACVGAPKIYEDHFEGDELCGGAPVGKNACEYVKEINFYIDTRALVDSDTDIVRERFNTWIVENGEFFEKFHIKTAFYPHGSGWGNRPTQKSANIEIGFLFERTHDEREMTVIFYTFSKNTWILRTETCQLNSKLNECLGLSMTNFLNWNVMGSLKRNRGE